jgi:tetratricopeptide (TPR) repeat protein
MNMGSIALNTRDFARALELIDGALPVFRRSLGEQSIDVAVVVRSRGTALKGLNDLDGALREFEAALAIQDAVASPTAAARIRILVAMIEVQCLRSKPDEARAAADLALKVLDPEKPADAKWIKDVQDQLAKCGGVQP